MTDRPAGGRESRALRLGPWPFVTLHVFIRRGRRLVWRARDHRKGLSPADRGVAAQRQPPWRRRWFNWLIGFLFAAGSTLFALGAALSLFPAGAAAASPLAINLTFFAGSVPFTIAGYLQHFQSANAGAFPGEARGRRVALIGWRPRQAGWLSTLAQFAGTVAFNFNTGDAIRPPAGWLALDVAVWAPGFAGSILFLVAGYLAFIETCHAWWRWAPRDESWRLAAVNLAGCVFFLMSSIIAFGPGEPAPARLVWQSNVWLLLGSLCFLAGGGLLMREARRAPA